MFYSDLSPAQVSPHQKLSENESGYVANALEATTLINNAGPIKLILNRRTACWLESASKPTLPAIYNKSQMFYLLERNKGQAQRGEQCQRAK